jgi:hypothetical protein
MITAPPITTYASPEEWQAEGLRRFGEFHKFRFVCPLCGHVQGVEDFKPFKDQGATPDSAFQVCIGRYTGAGETKRDPSGKLSQPCNYAGSGLFRLSPVRVKTADGKEIHAFGFAEA